MDGEEENVMYGWGGRNVLTFINRRCIKQKSNK